MIAMEIKKEVFERTGLVASAGVSYNKFLAKIASDMDKPDGFYLIKPEQAEKFLENLEVGLFFGVGKKTEEKMHKLGIYKGKDLKTLQRQEMLMHFGKSGSYYYDAVRGIDERPVRPHRERKSIGAERTFETDINDIELIKEKLRKVIDIMWERCQAKQKIGKTVTLKLRFSDFSTITRSNTITDEIYTIERVEKTVFDALPIEDIEEHGVRLLGVTMSNFPGEKRGFSRQLEFDFNKKRRNTLES